MNEKGEQTYNRKNNFALTWVLGSKRWKPFWKEMRRNAAPDFQEDLDEGWWTDDESRKIDWRQRLWETVM